VIKEVTSHFRNGCFFLVVMPSIPDIEPLIIENLVIKARKMTKEPRLRKKAKVEPAPKESTQSTEVEMPKLIEQTTR
jgi:hypothetical protein